MEGKTATLLYDFPDLPANKLSLLMTLDVVLRSDAYFNDDLTLVASRLLANVATVFKSSSTSQQARYARTLTHALESDSYSPMIRKACVTVSKWPVPSGDAGVDTDVWRSAMSKLFQAVGTADEDVRAEVWWTIIENVSTLNVAESPAVRQIIHLLTPIPGCIEVEQIKEIIPDEYLKQWRERTAHSTAQAQVLVRESLATLDAGQAGPSRKRKRDNGKDEELLRRFNKDFPEINVVEAKDILPGLLAHLRRCVTDLHVGADQQDPE